LRTWVQSQLNAGKIPAISEQLLSEDARKAYAAKIESRDEKGDLVYADDEERIKLLADAIEASAQTSYKDMTVEALRGLRDTVKQIEHLGRMKDKLLTAKDEANYTVRRDELAAAIAANAKQSGKAIRSPNTAIGKLLYGSKEGGGITGFFTSTIKAATWLQIFDGGEGGVWWNTLARTANERSAFEATQRAQATTRLMEALAPVLKDVKLMEKIGSGRFFPELGTSLNWEERFTIAANYGNESNLQRLMGGGIAGVTKVLTQQQVHAVLRTLTAAEWNAVQAVWDHFETYRPEIAAKEIRVNGVEPEWVDARPFKVQTADGQTVSLRGGYYPVVYDSRANLKAEQHANAKEAKDAMKAAYSAATTQRSFTKARVEEVKGRPLLLNLKGLYSGTNDVIHDLAWHEWVIDANKILGSTTLDGLIREHYGANVKHELTQWRDDIVAGSQRLDHGIENAAGWARKFVSASALTYNVISAIIQPLGLVQSFSRVGTAWVGRGIGEYLGGEGGPAGAMRRVAAQSEFMANRGRTMFRDLNELRNRVAGQTTARELMGKYGYFLTRHMQSVADVPTWLGAQQKALAEGRDAATAVAMADQAVKDSQGGGEEVDQAGITRGPALVKLFTVFYEFMNTQLNTLYLKGATTQDKANVFMHFALIGVVTPVLQAALRSALVPGDSGDWDDDKLIGKMTSEGLANLIGLVPFGREFQALGKIMLGQRAIDYSGPTGMRVVADTGTLAKQVKQGELDDAFWKAFINVLGGFTGIPSVQINRTAAGVKALSEGKTENPAAVVFGYEQKH
jgi:hypothetical protein